MKLLFKAVSLKTGTRGTNVYLAAALNPLLLPIFITVYLLHQIQ